MKTTGLDIGTYAIKVVVGEKKKDKLVIEKALEQPNIASALLPSDPQKKESLLQDLKSFWNKNQLPTSMVRVSLPESMVITKIVTMPSLSDAELASAIHWQVEQHIPIPLEELQYEYTVLSRQESQTGATMKVLIIGVHKQYVEQVADFLLEVGLDITDIETDTLAQLRCLSPKINEQQNIAFVHIGANTSTVTIMKKGVLDFVYSFNIAGFLLTRSIEQSIQLEPGRAEQYKRSYGLLPDKVEGKVRSALLPVVQSLVAEVQKAIHYFTSQNQGQLIERLYVSGGSMYLPDLFPLLSQSLSMEVLPSRLDEQQNLEWVKPVAQNSRFVTAIGLAMKDTKG